VRRGQFEDLDTPAIDILRDDEHEAPRRDAPPRGGHDGSGDAG
jgi:nitrogen fixation-related uncharacterized protein